jgi:hypothetical protein
LAAAWPKAKRPKEKRPKVKRMHSMISQTDIDTYRRDGVVLIKGLFADHVETLRAGIARNMAQPSEFGAENLKPGEGGRFFYFFCNLLSLR